MAAAKAVNMSSASILWPLALQTSVEADMISTPVEVTLKQENLTSLDNAARNETADEQDKVTFVMQVMIHLHRPNPTRHI